MYVCMLVYMFVFICIGQCILYINTYIQKCKHVNIFTYLFIVLSFVIVFLIITFIAVIDTMIALSLCTYAVLAGAYRI